MAAQPLNSSNVGSKENSGQLVEGGRRWFAGRLILPTSYSTGGYTFDGQLGFSQGETIDCFISGCMATSAGTVVASPVLNADTQVAGFTLFNTSTGAELANGTTVSGIYVLLGGN